MGEARRGGGDTLAQTCRRSSGLGGRARFCSSLLLMALHTPALHTHSSQHPAAHPAGRRFPAPRSGGGRGAWGRRACAAPRPPHPAPPGPPLQGGLGRRARVSVRAGASNGRGTVGAAALAGRAVAGCRLLTPPPCWPRPPTRDRQPNHVSRVGEVEAQGVAGRGGAGPHQRRLAVHVAAKGQGAGVRGAGEVPSQHRPAGKGAGRSGVGRHSRRCLLRCLAALPRRRPAMHWRGRCRGRGWRWMVRPTRPRYPPGAPDQRAGQGALPLHRSVFRAAAVRQLLLCQQLSAAGQLRRGAGLRAREGSAEAAHHQHDARGDGRNRSAGLGGAGQHPPCGGPATRGAPPPGRWSALRRRRRCSRAPPPPPPRRSAAAPPGSARGELPSWTAAARVRGPGAGPRELQAGRRRSEQPRGSRCR